MSSIMDDDGEDKEDSKRRTRNLSEKKRRDQFNMLVSELGSMVTTNRSRKMDKSTVLKSTISFIKSHNEKAILARANDVHRDWKPAFLSNEEFTYLVMEALESFVIVFSPSGQIYYVSESITSLLGHNPAHVVNQSIFDLTYEEDRTNLFSLLQNPGTGSESLHKDNEIQFQCRIRRGSPDYMEETIYEIVQFHGHFRSSIDNTDDSDGSSFHENEEITLFVCTGRLYTPQLIRDVSLVDSSRCEFTSRHSLEWKFLFLDHRAPPIIGYLPFEVLGTSGYDYYHFDDLEKVVTCHEALMQKGELTSCYYRFLTKGQQWIWLQTRFYITYHQWNSKPEFVVCTHQVVNYADVTQSTKQEVMDAENTMEVESKQSVTNETPTETSTNAPMSPSYMSEASDAYGNSYHTTSKAVSLKSGSSGTVATTSAASWPQGSQYNAHSDTASVSGESQCSQLNPTRNHPLKWSEPAPQHGIGAQYLDPVPFVGTVQAVGVPSIVPLSLPSLPVIVADQAQIQGQLHRKHEELQQMIVRQQEELRQVKEQLLLARLGILQPLLNVPHAYAHADELPPNARVPAQIVYEDPRSVGPPVYHHQHPHPHTNHSSHDPEHHQHHHHMQ